MTSEAAIQSGARLVMGQIDGIPQRNNVGAVEDRNGRHIRFGLMNASKQENERFKSSDLIGPVPIIIQPHHVGKMLGVYAAFECKHSDWTFRPSDERAVAQLRYIELMRSVGAIAGFVTHPDQVRAYVDAFR